jgi:hypothetical protein
VNLTRFLRAPFELELEVVVTGNVLFPWFPPVNLFETNLESACPACSFVLCACRVAFPAKKFAQAASFCASVAYGHWLIPWFGDLQWKHARWY